MAYTSQEKLPGHLPRPIQILICLPNCFSHGTYIVKATFRSTCMAFISKTIQILTCLFYQFNSVIAHTHTYKGKIQAIHASILHPRRHHYLVSRGIKGNFGNALLQCLPCRRRWALQWHRHQKIPIRGHSFDLPWSLFHYSLALFDHTLNPGSLTRRWTSVLKNPSVCEIEDSA